MRNPAAHVSLRKYYLVGADSAAGILGAPDEAPAEPADPVEAAAQYGLDTAAVAEVLDSSARQAAAQADELQQRGLEQSARVAAALPVADPAAAQAAAATCAVARSSAVDIDSIIATRKQTQTTAMTIMCHVATRIASLRLSMLRSSNRPASIASSAIVNPAPLANLATTAAHSVTPAAFAPYAPAAMVHNTMGKWTSIGWIGWPKSRIGSCRSAVLNYAERRTEQRQETDDRGAGMNEHERLLRHLAAQMDGGQIEAAERGDEQNNQRGQRRIRDTGGERGVDDQKQADGTEPGV